MTTTANDAQQTTLGSRRFKPVTLIDYLSLLLRINSEAEGTLPVCVNEIFQHHLTGSSVVWCSDRAAGQE